MDNDTKFASLMDSLGNDQAALQRFYANPIAELQAAQIPAFEAAASLGSTGTNYQLTVDKKWWGVDFVMNEDLTQAIATGAVAGPAITSLVVSGFAAAGIIAGPVAGLVAAAFGAAFVAKNLQLKFTDKGQGVHWPVSWLQWAGVVGAVPAGPAGILAAIMLFIHPVPN